MSDIREYHKLVRDKFTDVLEAKGVKYKTHEAEHDEFETELLEKLREEVLEFKNAKSMDELADLLEVVDAVINLYSWSREDIEAVKAAKLAERGGFTKRIILETTEE
jgi:predicted house-cleaning noncanonical NTP pyrophosphatase (MazG superfamily)